MIPAAIYTDVFNYTVLILVAIAAVECWSGSVFERRTRTFNAVFGAMVAVGLIFFIGLRPVSPYYFGDTINYARSFWSLQAQVSGTSPFTGDLGSEWVFNFAMRWFAANSDINLFFLFCAFIYVGALWWALVRVFGSDYFVPLVVALSMFTFFSYGVNGVRNGMAASVMILALSFRRRWFVAVLLAVLAMGIHRSMMLTAGAALVTFFVNRPRLWLWGWVGSIVVSLVAGGTISGWLVESGVIGDERFSDYLTGQTGETFSRTGFRWDFLLYSAIPVLVGWFFIFRRGYADKFYLWLFNIYLVANSFWILVVRADFSNRFAQISWFIMPLVLIYPFFMKKFWADQPVRTGTAVVFFYLYTFYAVFLSGLVQI
jgi:hypothetical protein